MNIIELKKFGLNLSGRGLGMSSYNVILTNYTSPYQLDFSEVNSLGSSFADEVVAKLAKLNGGQIIIYNCNEVILKCLKDVALEHQFELITKNSSALE